MGGLTSEKNGRGFVIAQPKMMGRNASDGDDNN
jgi:hypothetical protein